MQTLRGWIFTAEAWVQSWRSDHVITRSRGDIVVCCPTISGSLCPLQLANLRLQYEGVQLQSTVFIAIRVNLSRYCWEYERKASKRGHFWWDAVV
jgi:hypothetical protein